MPRRGRKRFRVPESFRVRASEQVRPDPGTIPLDYVKAKAIADWWQWEKGVEATVVVPPEPGIAWSVVLDDPDHPGAVVVLRTLGDAKPYLARLSTGQPRQWPRGHRALTPVFRPEAMGEVWGVLEQATRPIGEGVKR